LLSRHPDGVNIFSWHRAIWSWHAILNMVSEGQKAAKYL